MCVEVPVNRDAVLQFILMMLFLQRSGGSCVEDNPVTFSSSSNSDPQTRGFPSRLDCSTKSGFS
jgi:hypothetical protein